MSYDKPNRIKYAFPGGTASDWGAGSDTLWNIFGPKGKAGRMWDFGVEATVEAFTGTTTVPQIAVGSTSDPDAYGEEFSLNGLAINHAKSVRQTYDPIADSTNWATYMVERDIPKDTEVVVTVDVGTGSPTGQGVPFVIIDWDD